MAEIVPIGDGAALRKAQLIQDALETLRASNQIDERDDLSAASFLEVVRPDDPRRQRHQDSGRCNGD